MLMLQKKLKRKANPYAKATTQQQTKAPGQRIPVGSEKTIKQLLGELYGDRQYLEKLLKETGKIKSIMPAEVVPGILPIIDVEWSC